MAVTPQQIDLAWAKHDGVANIGISCGPSNLVVLDSDRAGEAQRWADSRNLTLPPTKTVATSKGDHRYYRYNHEDENLEPIGNSANWVTTSSTSAAPAATS